MILQFIIFVFSIVLANYFVSKIIGELSFLKSTISFIVFLLLSNYILSLTLIRKDIISYLFIFLIYFFTYIFCFSLFSGFSLLSNKILKYFGYSRTEKEIVLSFIMSLKKNNLSDNKIKKILKDAKFKNYLFYLNEFKRLK